jgi:hypothetical protein
MVRLLTHLAFDMQAFVSHYSQCTSVAEIVVVWNKGVPPLPGVDLPVNPGGVPVRERDSVLNAIAASDVRCRT